MGAARMGGIWRVYFFDYPNLLGDFMYQPVMLIGLGGTGKQVLLRLRRRFFEAGFIRQPWISYLWIDTDVRNNRTKLPPGIPPDYVSQQVNFTKDEICDIGVDRAQATQVMESPYQWENVWRWADLGLFQRALQNPDALTTGAQQTPPLGRLALFINAGGVRNQLLDRMHQLMDPTVQKAIGDAKRNNDISETAAKQLLPKDGQSSIAPNPKILIVGSLTGGTGSGLCVDIPGMLRAKDPNAMGNSLLFDGIRWLPNASIWGYFILPEAFLKDPKSRTWNNFNPTRVQVNAYSMLQEIEACQLQRTSDAPLISGQRDGGQLRASWLQRQDPDTAPLVPGPLYNACFLFDGHGQSNNQLNSIDDSYELISNLLYNDLSALDQNVQASIASDTNNTPNMAMLGHLEIVPPGQASKQRFLHNATWGDLYSFSYATAGHARVTFEAPRLRLMAAYTLAVKALERWKGEVNLNILNQRDGTGAVDAESFENARRLDASVKQRVVDELKRKDSAGGPLWEEYWHQQHPWATLDNIEQYRRERKTPKNVSFYSLFLSVETPSIKWNSTRIASEIEEQYLKPNGRFETMARDLMIRLPSDTVKDTDRYLIPGGLIAVQRALEHIPLTLRAFGDRCKHKTDETRKIIMAAREKVAAACAQADTAMRVYNSMGMFVFPSVRESVEQQMRTVVTTALNALGTYAQAVYNHGLYNSLSEAFQKVNDSERYKAWNDRWKDQIEKARKWLDRLLNNEDHQNGIWGLKPVLGHLQKIKPDNLTYHLALDIQSSPERLWKEIEQVYNDQSKNLWDDIEKIQQLILQEWAQLLNKLHAGQQEVSPFTHVIDLVMHSRMLSESQAIPLDRQINTLVELARKKTEADKLLDHRDVRQHLNETRAWLIDRSQLRSQLRDPVQREQFGFINRRAVLLGSQEKCFYMAPDGDSLDRLFDHKDTGNKLESRAVRFEMEIPLPNFVVLGAAWADVGQYPPELLHFQHPKTGYMPIHPMSPPDASDMQDRCVHGLLAVILGQFRPNDMERGGNFVWHIDVTQAAPQQLAGMRSIGDLIHHLRSGRLANRFDQVKKRNDGLLADLSLNTLLAVHAIVTYNLRFVARQEITFDAAAAARLQLASQDSGTNSGRMGPQLLVLTRLQQKVEAAIRQHGVAMTDDAILLALQQLGDFMHHYAYFVPVRIPDQNEDVNLAPKLLCLNTQIVRRVDMSDSADDLLSRRKVVPGIPNHVQHLSLRVPWKLYTERLGRETRRQHGEIIIAEDKNANINQSSMNPYSDNLGGVPLHPARIPFLDSWFSEDLVSGKTRLDGIVPYYPQFLKSNGETPKDMGPAGA